MKKNNRILIIPISIILFLSASTGCGSKKSGKKSGGNVELEITSHKTGQRVYNPLPLKMSGKIKNFKGQKKEELYIYLVEQSTKEKIWHIEPMAIINDSGGWRAVTWLGNRRSGKFSMYNICVFASPTRLKLRNGNHPVKEKPPHNGENCIQLKRWD